MAREIQNDNYAALMEKITELEAKSQKYELMLEKIKPADVIMNDVVVNSMVAQVNSVKKMQEELIQQLNTMKEKTDEFDLNKVVKINNKMKMKVKELELSSAAVEKHADKVEHMFTEFEKNFVEFKQFKGMVDKLNEMHDFYSKEFHDIEDGYRKLASKDEVKELKKEVKDLNRRMKRLASKEDLRKVKNKKRSKGKWGLFNV